MTAPSFAPILLIVAMAVGIGFSAGLHAGDVDYPDDRPPILGTKFTPPPTRVLKKQNLDPNQGVYVRRVYGNTAASNMGMQKGDVILRINDADIGSMSDVREVVSAGRVGEDVSVVVRRNGQDVELKSSYQPWPDSIPKKPIDAEAERRYRQAQARRLQAQEDDDEPEKSDAEPRQAGRTGSLADNSASPRGEQRRPYPGERAGPAGAKFRDSVLPDVNIPDAAAMLGDWEVHFTTDVQGQAPTDDALDLASADAETPDRASDDPTLIPEDLGDFELAFALNTRAPGTVRSDDTAPMETLP